MKGFITIVTFSLLTKYGTTLESLGESAACKQDYQAIRDTCTVPQMQKGKPEDFWSVLACLQNPPGDTQLSKECDSLLWEVKLNMTSQEGFLMKASKMCTDEINELRLCETDRISPAHFISCLVQKKHETRNPGCRLFLDRIESLIFSDFRLVGNFTHACKEDVKKYQCGRTGSLQNQPHSQGLTISCLQERVEELVPTCRKEIFQLAELQGERIDYDVPLFDSCQEEINKFCSGLAPNQQGLVYDCLMNNKLSPGMSEKCSTHITRRQRLTSLDYKVSASLATKCEADIKKHKCSDTNSADEVLQLSHIIVCLEDALFNGAQIAGECMASLDEHKHQLLQDLSISPEIIKYCKNDLNTHCQQQDNAHKLHCLMNVTLNHDLKLEEDCQKALEDFIRETEDDLDWRADPALEDACAEVVFSVCDPKNHKDRVMDCLMENLSSESEAMTGECRQVLMQIHYFMAREVIVDKKLYHECAKDATQLCGAGKNWHKKTSTFEPEARLVFPCLVRNMYHIEEDKEDREDENDDEDGDYVLSKDCEHQVERVLRQRARSVMLKPEMERTCRSFLHMHCASHIRPGEEMKCLQDNFDVLPEECKAQVSKDIQVQINTYYLHPNWIKGCEAELNTHCAGFHDRKDARGALGCLFRAAMDYPFGSVNGINKKCAAVLEGIQVLEMKDFKFSHDLRKACKPSVKKFCTNEKTTYGVVSCLVHTIIDDIVNDKDAKIGKECITQLDLELQMKHSNLKLDPVLTEACKDELTITCSGHQGLDAVECLKKIKHADLSKKCANVLLQEEEDEAINNQVDIVLMRNCKKEIQQHCSHSNNSQIITCLAEFANEIDFDQKCMKTLKNRISQHSFDFRLNTNLARACSLDVRKYCSKVIQDENGFNEGKVIYCLKEIYTQNVNLLTKGCSRELMTEVKQESLAQIDPRLESLCPKMIGKCKRIISNGDRRQSLEACLYHHLEQGDVPDGQECSMVLAVHAESQNRDIASDVDLYNACSLDLAKFCRDVVHGDGKKFACLVSVTKEKNFALEPNCEKIIEDRVEMYKVALKIHPVQEPWEVYKSIMESEDRNSILSMAFFILAVIFIFGLCFGRVSKRVNRDVKNK